MEYTTDFMLIKDGKQYYLGTPTKRYTPYFSSYHIAEAMYDYAQALGKLYYNPDYVIPDESEIPF